jgi:hypothetical protein
VFELAQLQDWYRGGEQPQLRFPYSLNFFKSGFWVQLLDSRHAFDESEGLWNNTTAVDLQFAARVNSTLFGAPLVLLNSVHLVAHSAATWPVSSVSKTPPGRMRLNVHVLISLPHARSDAL